MHEGQRVALDPKVVEEHEQLTILLRRVADQEDIRSLRVDLEKLLPLLREHFEREEQEDGLFEQLRSRNPNAHDRLGELQTEHATLLKSLEVLVERVDACIAAHDTIDMSRKGLVDALHEHHQLEDQLIIEIFYREEGTVD